MSHTPPFLVFFLAFSGICYGLFGVITESWKIRKEKPLCFVLGFLLVVAIVAFAYSCAHPH